MVTPCPSTMLFVFLFLSCHRPAEFEQKSHTYIEHKQSGTYTEHDNAVFEQTSLFEAAGNLAL